VVTDQKTGCHLQTLMYSFMCLVKGALLWFL